MTTFIAGGTGFVGRRLVRLLAQYAAKKLSASPVLQIINDIRKEEGLPQLARQ
jgi:nucleoside-diphosphate-sugar epimerase